MIYIYDILLNFNDNLIEYFEWEDKDNIKYIKKISVFKTNQNTIKDIINNDIILEEKFINNIPKYEMNGLKNSRSVCLLTDGLIVVGLLINDRKIISISRLLLDEEKEILELTNNLEEISISYEIINKKDKNRNNLTRKELVIRNKLLTELNSLYDNKQYNKIYYLYYEYTNKENKNPEYTYNFLINTLNNFNNKHLKLHNILLLSDKKN